MRIPKYAPAKAEGVVMLPQSMISKGARLCDVASQNIVS